MQQTRLSDDGPLAAGVEVPPLRIHSRAHISALASASVHQKIVQLGTVEPPVLALLKHWSKPAVVVALFIAILLTSQPITPAYGALALGAVLIARQIFSPLRLLSDNSSAPAKPRLLRLMLEWGAVAGLLLCMGISLKLGNVFPRNLILTWSLLTPLTLVMGDYWSTRALVKDAFDA